jgi:hypothetical protein
VLRIEADQTQAFGFPARPKRSHTATLLSFNGLVKTLGRGDCGDPLLAQSGHLVALQISAFEAWIKDYPLTWVARRVDRLVEKGLLFTQLLQPRGQ